VSESARVKLNTAARDDQGRVIGLTREQGKALDDQVRGNAIAANLFYVATAALAGTGGVLFFVSDRTTVSASPAGVSVVGALP
jgi:hypothetical protein